MHLRFHRLLRLLPARILVDPSPRFVALRQRQLAQAAAQLQSDRLFSLARLIVPTAILYYDGVTVPNLVIMCGFLIGYFGRMLAVPRVVSDEHSPNIGRFLVFSLVDSVHGPTAAALLVWTFNGLIYRTSFAVAGFTFFLYVGFSMYRVPNALGNLLSLAAIYVGSMVYLLKIATPQHPIFPFLLTVFSLSLAAQIVRRAHHDIRAQIDRLNHEALLRKAQADAARLAGHSVAVEQLYRDMADLAHQDALTGLPNRRACEAFLNDCIVEGEAFTLILFDIDHFKSINDSLGHQNGDGLMVTLSQRLKLALPQEVFLGRLGGDEFVVIVPVAGDQGRDKEIIRRMLSVAEAPITLASRQITPSLSLGHARYPDAGATASEMFVAADLALYTAKRNGRGRAVAFTTAMRQRVRAERQARADLPEALRTGAVTLWFQPQVRLDQSTTVGFEGLLRWMHPTLGVVDPPLLLRLASEAGASDRLMRRIINEAVAFRASLLAAGHGELHVAFNLSPDHLSSCNAAEEVAATLAWHGIGPEGLQVEMTEERIIDQHGVRQEAERLLALGLTLAIDDFGAGFASLASLRLFPFQLLKLDRSLVRHVSEDRTAQVLLDSAVAIGSSLGAEVLAEGVETEEDRQALLARGVRLGQGFLFGHAQPAEVHLNRLAHAST